MNILNQTFSNTEEAKKYIKNLVPLGYFDSGTKKIVGYTKYGNKEIGYKYVPNFKFVNSDGTLGRSKFELRQKDFEEHFRNRIKIPEYMKL